MQTNLKQTKIKEEMHQGRNIRQVKPKITNNLSLALGSQTTL